MAPESASDVDSDCHGSPSRHEYSKLIQAARDGRPEALNELLGAVYGYLKFVAAQETWQAYSAQCGLSDLVQKGAVDILKGFPTFKGNCTAEFICWVRMILKNNAVDEHRKQQKPVQKAGLIEDDKIAAPSADNPLAQAIHRESAADVKAALARLPGHYAEVLRLKTWEGKTCAQIGHQMERSEDAVRKVWCRALVCLRKELESQPLAGARS